MQSVGCDVSEGSDSQNISLNSFVGRDNFTEILKVQESFFLVGIWNKVKTDLIKVFMCHLQNPNIPAQFRDLNICVLYN